MYVLEQDTGQQSWRTAGQWLSANRTYHVEWLMEMWKQFSTDDNCLPSRNRNQFSTIHFRPRPNKQQLFKHVSLTNSNNLIKYQVTVATKQLQLDAADSDIQLQCWVGVSWMFCDHCIRCCLHRLCSVWCRWHVNRCRYLSHCKHFISILTRRHSSNTHLHLEEFTGIIIIYVLTAVFQVNLVAATEAGLASCPTSPPPVSEEINGWQSLKYFSQEMHFLSPRMSMHRQK